VPFAITGCETDRARTWCRAAAAMVAAVMLSFSHSIAGFMVAMLVVAWPVLRPWPWLRRVAAVGVVAVFLVMNVAATASIRSVSFGESSYTDASQYHHAVDQKQLRVGGATIAYSVMSYARIKQVAWRAFTEHPIAGIGLDRFHTETMRAFSEGWLPSTYRQIDPHSTLPGRLAECGLIGGITLLLLWLAWAALARDAVRAHPGIGLAAAAALAGLIVASLNADIMNFRFLWAIAGLLRGLQASTPSPQTARLFSSSGRAGR
jgi:O-antigen ligase